MLIITVVTYFNVALSVAQKLATDTSDIIMYLVVWQKTKHMSEYFFRQIL